VYGFRYWQDNLQNEIQPIKTKPSQLVTIQVVVLGSQSKDTLAKKHRVLSLSPPLPPPPLTHPDLDVVCLPAWEMYSSCMSLQTLFIALRLRLKVRFLVIQQFYANILLSICLFIYHTEKKKQHKQP